MAGKFEIFKNSSASQPYYFHLKASNGEIILNSEMYTDLGGAKNGISSVKTNSPYDWNYERLIANDGSPYFNLKAGNNKIIGTSEMYSSTSARDKGIESVKTNAPNAEIVDNT